MAQKVERFPSFSIPSPEDPHGHLRELLEVIRDIVKLTLLGGVRRLGGMPNTKDGLLDAASALAYKATAEAEAPPDEDFSVISYIQITYNTTKAIIDECVAAGVMDAKVYPLGRTTKSDLGIRDYFKLIAIIVYAVSKGMRVHFHPEHPNMLIENRDAEYLFIPIMDAIMREITGKGYPGSIWWEHGTDARCIPFWKEWAESSGQFYVTITAHHLAGHESGEYGDNRSVCKPSFKTLQDMTGLRDLVGEDHPWVMFGSDSAFHDVNDKLTEGPCHCGAFTAPFVAALLAHALRDLLIDAKGREIFANFTSRNAWRVYGKPDTIHWITIHDKPTTIQPRYKVGSLEATSFWGGREISCSMQHGKHAPAAVAA